MNITMTNGSTATAAFKNQINTLIQEVFGFSFDKWQDRNLWDNQYEMYTIIEGNQAVANISAYKMKLLLSGEPRDFLQLGAVATKEQYRGKGLSRKIMEHIFAAYPDTPKFLHANDSVTSFYPRFGFVPFTYKQPILACDNLQGCGMVKLELDDPKVDAYLRNRSQYSRIFDCLSPYAINWFHLLYFHADHIYEVPALQALIIAEQKGKTLHLHDVIATTEISFSQVLPCLSFPGAERIAFGFTPDWLKLDYAMTEMELDHPYIRGEFAVSKDFRFPDLIMT